MTEGKKGGTVEGRVSKVKLDLIIMIVKAIKIHILKMH